MSSFDQAIPVVLKHEGGFVNNAKDPGGVTNFGVSIRFLVGAGDLDKDGFLDGDIDHDGDIDAEDIKKMTVEDAKKIYRLHFWDKYGYTDILGQQVATKIFDMCVNMGGKQAHILAQRACNSLVTDPAKKLTEDGVLGPTSKKRINEMYSTDMLRELRTQCSEFYLRLIEKKPDLATFKNGWLRRAAS